MADLKLPWVGHVYVLDCAYWVHTCGRPGRAFSLWKTASHNNISFFLHVHALFWHWTRIMKLWTQTRIGISKRLTCIIMFLTTSKTKGWHRVSTRNPMRRPTDHSKPFTYSILTLRMLHPRYLYIYDLLTWPWLWLFFTDIEMQQDGSCHHDHPHEGWPTW